MPEEKRRFSRIAFKVAAELTVAGMSFSTDHIDNLSIGGCLFPSSRNFPIETPCRIIISLDGAGDSPKVTVTGKIMRCDQYGIGVRFTGIDPDSLFHLHNIIRYNAPDPDQIEQEIDDHPGLV
jgi:hypothetical protein